MVEIQNDKLAAVVVPLLFQMFKEDLTRRLEVELLREMKRIGSVSEGLMFSAVSPAIAASPWTFGNAFFKTECFPEILRMLFDG